MKTYLKTLGRAFKRHFARFLSLIMIVLVCIGFISGIGMSAGVIEESMTDYYVSANVSDFIIKSTSQNGFSQEDIDAVAELFPGADIDTGMTIDIASGEKRSLRLQFMNLSENTVNKLEIIEGEASDSPYEVYALRASDEIEGYEVGDTIVLDFKEILINLSEQNGTETDSATSAMLDRLEPVTVTVCGIVQSPVAFAKSGEPSYNNDADASVPDDTAAIKEMDLLKNQLYISSEVIPTMSDIMPWRPDTPLIPTGDIYVAVADRTIFDAYSAGYESFVDSAKTQISGALSDTEIITLYENYSFKSLKAYSDKTRDISLILIAVFLLVTALVVFSTMTRMVDEERSQVACLETLGYSAFKIIFKYLLFAFIATSIGGFFAYFVGFGISWLVYVVFGYSFFMPAMTAFTAPIFYVISLAAIIVGTLVATGISGVHMTREAPANLLRPKAPKAGRKVFLEKIPFIWNRLSFKYKSTFRNVLRYVNRFIMSVVSIAFSTALVLTGLTLLDMSLFHGYDAAAIVGIAVVIVVFAGLVTAVVIYTLTNINISERQKEIATLMVLGYHDREVTGYIYREIYINSIIGIIFGFPASLPLMYILFDVMGTGSFGEVSWFMWVATPVIVLLFTFIVTLLLRRKITRIDMNESLKAIE